MNRITILIIFFNILTTSIIAQSVSEKFDEAMFAYNNEQFAQANRLFEEFFSDYKITDEVYATAKYYSAESLLKLGRKNDAAISFEYLVDNFFWSSFRDKALYNIGLIYFESGSYENARKRLKQLLNDYPESEFYGSALYLIGESYSKENKFSEAVKFLEEAVADKRNKKNADYTIYTLANVYEKTGDYQNAVKYYDQLLTFYPNSSLATSAQIRIGICYFKLKDYQSSILELNNPNLTDLPGDLYSESLFILATSYYRAGEYENAEKSFTEVIQKFPESRFFREAEYGLGWTHFQQKKYNDAFVQFDGLSSGEDSLAVLSLFWKGECKRYLGRNDEAYNIYKQFLDNYPNHYLEPEVKYLMGVILYGGKDVNLASRYLLSAISSPDTVVKARAFTLLGEIELSKNNYQAAKNYFEPVLQFDSNIDNVKIRSLLGAGIASYHLGQNRESITYLLKADSIDANFEQQKMNFFLAENYFELNDFSDANYYYSKAAGSDNNLTLQTLYGKAYCFLNAGDYENAAYAFNDFIKKYPNDKRFKDAKLRLADSYFGSKNFAAASKVYKELFASDVSLSKDPSLRYQYAQAIYKSGKSVEAINEFNAIQEEFPNSEYADVSLYTVAWIYFQQGDFSQAVARYNSVLKKYPKTTLEPVVYYSIGDAYFNEGKYDSAIVYYERVFTRFPKSKYVFDAANGIQYSYVAKGTPDKAVNFISGFVAANPNLTYSDQLLFKKGEIYYSQEDYKNAKNAYAEFVAAYPKSDLVPDAYFLIGKSAQALGLNEEAVFNFEKVYKNYKASPFASASVLEMGNIFRETKNYEQALKTYDDALKELNNSPKVPEILFNKGVMLTEMKNFQAAYEVFDEVNMYYPQTLFADKSKFEMAMIDMVAERYDNSDSFFADLAVKRSDDLGAKAQYYQGFSLYEQGKFNEAITALVRVRTVFSKYDEWLTKSYLLLGDCYVKLNDLRNAQEMYRAVISKYSGTPYGDEALQKLRKIQ